MTETTEYTRTNGPVAPPVRTVADATAELETLTRPTVTTTTAKPSNAEAKLLAQIKRLEAENAALKAKGTSRLTFKVAEKGGLSVYGLGRFPVTLFREQWERLLAVADQIKAFIKEHDAELKRKGE